MRHAYLILVSAWAIALIVFGWGHYWLTDLSLLVGGIYTGHILTELLNDPSE
jgi:hypothetical protein